MRLGRKLKGVNPVGIASDYSGLIFVIVAVVLMFVAFLYILGFIDPDFALW